MKTKQDYPLSGKTIITMSILKIEDEYEGRYYIDGKQDENKTVYEDSLQACKDTLQVTFIKLLVSIVKHRAKMEHDSGGIQSIEHLENYDLIEDNIREDLNLLEDSLDFIQIFLLKKNLPNEWEIETFTRFIPKFWI